MLATTKPWRSVACLDVALAKSGPRRLARSGRQVFILVTRVRIPSRLLNKIKSSHKEAFNFINFRRDSNSKGKGVGKTGVFPLRKY